MTAECDDVVDFLVGRPDVLQKDRLAIVALTQRGGGDVLADIAEQRVGDHQRRAGEVVGAHVRMHAAFEVTVAGEHRDRDQLVRLDGIGDRIFQRAGIADAGGAAIADGLEAQRVQVLRAARIFRDIR